MDVPASADSSCAVLMPLFAFAYSKSVAETCEMTVASLVSMLTISTINYTPPDPAWVVLRDACPNTCALAGAPTAGCAPPEPPPTAHAGLTLHLDAAVGVLDPLFFGGHARRDEDVGVWLDLSGGEGM